MRRLALSYARDRRGSAAAEIALMLPLMLIVMFSTFEAAHYFYTEQKIIEAVRQGARYAGRLPFSSYTCPGSINGTTADEIKTVTRTGTVGGTDPLIRGWSNTDITVTLACNSGTSTGVFQGNAGGAPIVTVAATADYSSLFGAFSGFTATQVRASSQATVNGI